MLVTIPLVAQDLSPRSLVHRRVSSKEARLGAFYGGGHNPIELAVGYLKVIMEIVLTNISVLFSASLTIHFSHLVNIYPLCVIFRLQGLQGSVWSVATESRIFHGIDTTLTWFAYLLCYASVRHLLSGENFARINATSPL